MEMVRVPRCFFCARTDVAWCDWCKAYLCPQHEKDYPRRGAHAISHPVDTGRKILDLLVGR